MNDKKRVLLIVSGGIAAVKAPELIRLLKMSGCAVRCILTKNAGQFVTALSLAALSQDKVYEDLFSLMDENEMGHIELSRDADLLLVAPATANIIAKIRMGIADDLACTALLATDKPIMLAPAMNVHMWEHAATKENISILRSRGVLLVPPEVGEMACGEYGRGRMAEPETITNTVVNYFASPNPKSHFGLNKLSTRLKGKKAIVTSGPTHESIDPARYIGNHSSGRQGHAIAAALAQNGAKTILVSGPTKLTNPNGVKVLQVNSAHEMLQACENELPADIMVCAAAVADWHVANPSESKMKKSYGPVTIQLSENADILSTISKSKKNRPPLVIGFAAETESIIENAQKKLTSKGCDWIIANDVSAGTDTFGGPDNTVHIVDHDGIEDWPTMSKEDVGRRLVERIGSYLMQVQG